MRRKFAFLLAIILVLSCLAGCQNPEKTEDPPVNGEEKKPENDVLTVTEENVAELFGTSLKAYFMDMGTAFYDLETDENGGIVSYWENEELRNSFNMEKLTDCFKVVSDITAEEIINKMNAHTNVSENKFVDESCFVEYKGDLYVGQTSSLPSLYDMNSISLYRTAGDRYYVTVDLYGTSTYDFEEDIFKEGVPDYWRSYIFETTLKDGILFIEDVETYPGIQKDDESLKPENERNYMSFAMKYPTVTLYKKGEKPDKVGDDKVNENNVSELFKTSLEAYVMWDGSAFIEVERDDNGVAVNYLGNDDLESIFESQSPSTCFKVINGITLEEIKKKVEAHTSKFFRPIISVDEFYAEYNGDLYLALASTAYGTEHFDENSIKLYKIDGNVYYVTVDLYSSSVPDSYFYANDYAYEVSFVFKTVLKDGVLFIEDVKESGITKNKNELNPKEKRSYVCDYSHFYDITE